MPPVEDYGCRFGAGEALLGIATKGTSYGHMTQTYLRGLSGKYEALIWSDNLVGELATMCLPWQHWTKALVWFDDVDISVFHSCVVVDLWRSLSEWHLLMSACVLVCCRGNVGA